MAALSIFSPPGTREQAWVSGLRPVLADGSFGVPSSWGFPPTERGIRRLGFPLPWGLSITFISISHEAEGGV